MNASVPPRVLVALSLVLPSVAARGAEPDAPPEAEPVEDDQVSGISPDELMAVEFVAHGLEKFQQEDYHGAIEEWEQAYALLPPCQLSQRDQLHSLLGNAYWEAYQTDHVEADLRKAKEQYQKHLESLGASDPDLRKSTEDLLAEIGAEIERIDTERIAREREQAAREAVAAEQERQRQQALAEREARIEHEHRRTRMLLIVGGSTAGLGVASLSVMVTGMALGAKIERDGDTLTTDPNADFSDFQSLLSRGTTYNRMAWATGAVGGVLTIVGTAALTSVWNRRRGAKTQARVRVAPGGPWNGSAHGVEVRF